ncbi:Ankyrin repeat-containing domain [Phytophthora cactorum]|nr:Ankyrin repeat-containing domain [Phytophthora cactorum]
MRASEMGNADVVDILLKRGVAVDTLDSSGVTALIRASERGNTDVVNCLLRSGAVVDLVENRVTLHSSVLPGRVIILSWSAVKYRQATSDWRRTLLVASEKDTARLWIYLLRMEHRQTRQYALIRAAENGHAAVV